MACSTPPQLESTLRIFTQDWYPSSPPPSRPGYSVCPAPTDAGCPPRVQRASGLVNTWRCWEGGMPREGMGAPRLTPRLILCISSIRLVPSCNLYNKPLTILKLSPKESGLQNQADPAPPATRHRVWSPFYRDCRHLPKASSSSSRHPWQRLGRTHAALMPIADSWEVGKTQAWEWSSVDICALYVQIHPTEAYRVLGILLHALPWLCHLTLSTLLPLVDSES
ncbi:uncharacterized protein [Equus przewalskii]|uniref:Uncharacterized protein isoform X2 n=1 Tax=Equus przewalskii TaxID=9798 RepID=A0ABM4L9W0_EQUPR